MEDECGRLINFAKLQIYSAEVTFLRSPSLFGSRSCDLALSSGNWWVEEVSWNQILFQFLDFQNHGDSCVSLRQSTDKIDWDTSNKKINGLKNSYCGSEKPPLNQPFKTEKYHSLVIKFDAANYKDDASISFKLVANVLHSDGKCSYYECDNGNCIPTELKCSQHNPCGDNSECRPDGISVKTVIFIVIGVIAGLVLAFLFVKYFRCSKLCKTDDNESVGEGDGLADLQGGEGRGTAEPSAPHLHPQTGVDVNGTNDDIEQTDMLHDSMLPPPSYEEVMRQEK
ncbi:uncharacterized protein LOC123549703 [Mercenaria mercenaria]|uniref:uncharacterized protein LOC123549703 n=1 Tax=Mercenaria mercenaria TaxID=6596 RepID=UPI001E1D62DB|nr:uncharacterized protein LOC123549703 [Mercenaria mercenaria]